MKQKGKITISFLKKKFFKSTDTRTDWTIFLTDSEVEKNFWSA